MNLFDWKNVLQPKSSVDWNTYVDNIAHYLYPLTSEMYWIYPLILVSKDNVDNTPDLNEEINGADVGGFGGYIWEWKQRPLI